MGKEDVMGAFKWLGIGAAVAGASYGTYVASTWLRYGHPRTPKPEAADPLLERFMAAHDVVERHHVRIEAPPHVTFAAARDVRLDSSRIVRAIFQARALILRTAVDMPKATQGIVEQMTSIGWGVLAETPTELVFGAVTKPWEANPTFRPLPPEEFAAFAEPDHVKIVWTLRVDAAGDGGSVFRTETRAVATDAGARRKFRRYWSLVSPGIIVIRAMLMPIIKREAERRWRIEGDDVLDARAQLTHAIAIDAPPEDVWPWLLQMGCQRAGWYSWDRLDNGGARSADRIIPELQHLAEGDVLPARPTGSEGFQVIRIVPGRAIVLSGISPDWAGTWAFALEPLEGGRTRLVTRYRAAYPPNVKMAVALPILRAVHAFMEGKQLRTIKHHAEHLHAS
ncbi:MAG: hypothetical protein JNL83_20590 [Myxococcales bacterium]|nr:hypothetical protein [Myxococcales bacterium]